MNNIKSNTGNLSKEESKRAKRLAFWAAAYVITMAVASFGPDFLWDYNQVLSIGGIVLNLGVGIGMILENIRHLNDLDELMRKIQLEAMGLSLGIGVVAGLSYTLFDVTNIIQGDAEIAYLIILIGLVYLTSLFVNYRRYR